MSRNLVVIAMLGVLACTDQNDVSAPEQPAAPAAAAGPSGVELDFDLGRIREAHTALSGGATTVFDITPAAFSLPAPTLAGLSLARHEEGDEDFEVAFVPSVPGAENGGLGPVFDNVSCEACHVGDGRGRPPLPGEAIASPDFQASGLEWRTPPLWGIGLVETVNGHTNFVTMGGPGRCWKRCCGTAGRPGRRASGCGTWPSAIGRR